MAAAALIGYGTLLIVAFGVRSVLHRLRTRSSGWIGPPTPAAAVGDGLFAAGVLATLTAPMLDLVGASWTIGALHGMAIHLVGAAVLAAGSSIAVAAQAQMGTAWRAGIDLSDDQLVRRGLYDVVRNPFYLGMMMAAVGVAGMTANGLAFLGAAAIAAGCEVDVRLVEEPHLRATHADTYESYMAATPRFVPNPLRRVTH